MSTNDPFTRIAEAWLADGPTELPDRVLEHAFEEIHRHPRRRVFAPGRPGTMSSMLKLAAAAVVVVATVTAGSFLMNRAPAPDVGGPAVPSVTPAPAASPSASAASATAPAASATILGGSGRLEAGRYSTDLIRPAVEMELPCCFEVVTHDSALLVLGEVGLDRYLAFSNPRQVLDPESGEWTAVPRDLAAWLAGHPGLEVGPASDVTIGGLSGHVVEGTPRPDADYNASGELALMRSPAVGPISIASDHRFRIAVLGDAEQPLVVTVTARADRFEEFDARTRDVIDALAFAAAGG